MSLKRFLKNLTYLFRYNLKEISKSQSTIEVVNDMIDNLKYEIYDELQKNEIKIPKIADRFETLAKLVNSNCSLSRFGDGEFMLIHETSIHFQEYTPEISQRLKEILLSQDDDIMICLADFLGSFSQYTTLNRDYWREYLKKSRSKIYKFIDFNKQYYDACVTRPYINYIDKSKTAQFYFDIKKLWKNNDIVVIEGSKTRIGVGNDLLNDAKSIKRIIAPEVNAYSKYTEILNEAKKLPKSSLFLISLGPTATVLAYDLAKLGFRAIDSGHLDVEYEWFLAGVNERTKIKGKYVWEAPQGILVDNLKDEKYQNEIIITIQ